MRTHRLGASMGIGVIGVALALAPAAPAWDNSHKSHHKSHHKSSHASHKVAAASAEPCPAAATMRPLDKILLALASRAPWLTPPALRLIRPRPIRT